MLQAKPIELKEANAFVETFHRHHKPVYRDKFRIAATNEYQKLVGVVQLARPVSRVLDDGQTIEVVRLCSDGTRNVCSFLYSRAAKVAQLMGYRRIITYILDEEQGTSLKASGWKYDHTTTGGRWDCPARPRNTDAPTGKKQMWVKNLNERNTNNERTEV